MYFRVCVMLYLSCGLVTDLHGSCAAMQGCVCVIYTCIYGYIWLLMYI